jgi:hypothetical protein
MSAHPAPTETAVFDDRRDERSMARRLSTETKAAFKTTEFFTMIAVIAGIVISAAVVEASQTHGDHFVAWQAWLFVAIVAVGYMVSRGLAKSGSRDFYDERR